MARIVLAWEFGGGLGHIQYDLPLVKKLQERGHEVICIMKHVIDAERIMGQQGIKILQAPVWQITVKNRLANTYNYAEILLNNGYLIEDALSSMARAWRNLLNLIQPDLLIADHSPTALIAARAMGIKTILYGTGFFAPPLQSPMPPIILWTRPPAGVLVKSERMAVEAINKVLEETDSPLLESLSDLFDVNGNILTTFKELDHYQTREGAQYWGPVFDLPAGKRPIWPEKRGAKKIFCYLKPNYPYIEELLAALNQGADVSLVFSQNLPKETSEKFRSSTVVFSDKPFDMKQICNECDLVVCHAGHGTIAVSLLHGKPLLLIPEHNQLEQILSARNIAVQKLGLLVLTVHEDRPYRETIDRLISEPGFSVQAQKFAAKYKEFDPAGQMNEIADHCEEILGS